MRESSHLVLFGGPESHGGDGGVGDLQTGGVTVTSPHLRAELTEDVLHTVQHHGLAEVAGRLVSPQVGPVQVERVETLAVSQHRVKHTEPLALLNTGTGRLSIYILPARINGAIQSRHCKHL